MEFWHILVKRFKKKYTFYRATWTMPFEKIKKFTKSFNFIKGGKIRIDNFPLSVSYLKEEKKRKALKGNKIEELRNNVLGYINFMKP
jgi:hypothetical protein